MPIYAERVQVYVVYCDGCGLQSEYFFSTEDALNTLIEDGWVFGGDQEYNDKWYCPMCVAIRRERNE